jgi:voltage-gated potassium channel Kch
LEIAMSLHATEQLFNHRLRSWLFWIPLGLAVAGVICGLIGHYEYDKKWAPHVDYSSGAYHTLQLFVLHSPHMEHEVPAWLHAGRWLVSAAVLILVGCGLYRVFRAEWLLVLAPWRNGHIVICGLGRLGLRLAEEFRRAGLTVVAIDADASVEMAARASEAGYAVITGDARTAKDLNRAAASRAKQVIAVCDDEQTNVAIAAAVGELIRSPKARRSASEALECWIFVADTPLRRALQAQRESVFPHVGDNFRVNVRGLDLFELAARNAFKNFPLDFEQIGEQDSTLVHLIIVGFGPMGQNLALQAAKIGHFANFEKLKITVIEAKENPTIAQFKQQYPQFENTCTLQPEAISLNDGDFETRLKKLLPPSTGPKELVTIAFCWDASTGSASGERDMFRRLEHDDATNLRLALGFPGAAELAKNDKLRVLVFQTRKNGYGCLFSVDGRSKAIGTRMEGFGLVDDMYAIETLFDEEGDKIAKVLHEIYVENQIKVGNPLGSKPAIVPWDVLAGEYRESNRQAADHIPVKLRALGYRIEPKRPNRASETALENSDNVELLAKMEHHRWNAEKWLLGYEYGEARRDKYLPYLVEWEKLNDGVKEYDRHQVRGIPEALARAGFGIYRFV